MARASRRVPASQSAAASRRTSARKASPASARLGRRTTSAQTSQRARGAGRQPPTGGPSPRTRQQLYQEAKARDVKGRSTMTKAELERALRR